MFKRRYQHVLAASARIEGDFRFEKLLLLEGALKGALIGMGKDAGVLVRGKVQGPVTADLVYVEGTIEGDVTAREVIVYKGGAIRGKLQAEAVHLLKGGQVEGEVRVTPAVAAQPAPTAKDHTAASVAKSRLLEISTHHSSGGTRVEL